MKNNNPKSPAKSAKKAAANNIEQSLVNALKEATAKLGQGSKEILKAIEKGSKRLAKKISKELVFEKPTVSETAKSAAVVSEPKKPKTTTKAKATPKVETAPAAVKKTIKPDVSTKPAVNNTKPVKKTGV